MALPTYDIDFEKLVKMLLPSIKRKTVRVSWLTAILKPLRNIHDEFVEFADAKIYDARRTGQTIVLENLLIEKFGAGITITNNELELNGAFVGDGIDQGCFIGEGSDIASYIDVTYSVGTKSFTVSVPSAITFVQSEMEAVIDQFKLYGTTYEIVII